MSTMGERVRARRTEMGLTQSQLAKAMDDNQAAISDWERGQGSPKIGKVAKLAEALNVSLDWLIHGTGEPPPVESAEENAEVLAGVRDQLAADPSPKLAAGHR